jgi:predicted nuclease of predicted toxin-antitoxin system
MSGVIATIRFLADHNFNDHILTGLLALDPTLDIVRTRDVGLSRAPDEDLLEWAAVAGHVVLTHDEHTMVGFAYGRVTAGLPMPGVVLVHQWVPVKRAIDDVLYLAQAGPPADFDGRVIHVPLPP